MEQVNILLLDDEPIVGQRLKSGLVKIGCDVETFEHPLEAISRIAQKRFDIVITDVMMAEASGIQVLEAAKKLNPAVKVIIITGYATAELAREAMEKGAYDMIAKPFKPADLRALVVRAMQELGVTEPVSAVT
ncbi:MAG: response regulator [Desulfobacterales bacterium]